jgi:hypothetical protein
VLRTDIDRCDPRPGPFAFASLVFLVPISFWLGLFETIQGLILSLQVIVSKTGRQIVAMADLVAAIRSSACLLGTYPAFADNAGGTLQCLQVPDHHRVRLSQNASSANETSHRRGHVDLWTH